MLISSKKGHRNKTMKTKHLGKIITKTPVGYKILDPIIRDRLSESHGIDIWVERLDTRKILMPYFKIISS